MIAYDGLSGLPVNGAIERGVSSIASDGVSNTTLLSDAIRQATATCVGLMRGYRLPAATILSMCVGIPYLNQGTRAGFAPGMALVAFRQGQVVGTGHVGIIEPDQAELIPDLGYERLTFAPGDRVRAIFVPPALPPKGWSVLRDAQGGRR
ncbi:hypothetical protein EON79_23990 [bacterium]|nr:MAG: hypothetical protein EON79_23990 [bacterium]